MFDSSGTYIKSSTTDGSGNYSLTLLPAGTYKLYVAPVTPGYGLQWFGGPSFAGATPIAVSANTTQNILL